MKKNIFLFMVGFAMFVILPFSVNAENIKDYNVEVKNLEDYVCEELKEHSLEIVMQTYNKIVVYDETDDKEYLIDFSNIGVCEEYTDQEFDEDYVPTEYSWDGNNLYLETYSSNYLFVHAKTLDKELEPNSSYSTLESFGFVGVNNPVTADLSNYYEAYYFELATGEYIQNEKYYEIKEYQNNEHNDYYKLATTVELDETTYEASKYYVIAKPIKKELIGQFISDTFIVPKNKSGLTSDLTLSRFDFSFHFEFGNKTYYVFRNLEDQNRYFAIFDEDCNYQTFGLDNLLAMSIFSTDDNKYLSFLVKVDNKNHLVLLDEKLNMMVLYDVSQYGDDITFIGNDENDFYYSIYYNKDKILKINYIGSTDTYKVTFDANGGVFKDGKNIMNFDNWDWEMLLTQEQPTREGYKFKGWYIDKEFKTPLAAEPNMINVSTIYAKWELNQEVPKTLDNITSSILMGTLSLIGLVGTAIYLKKKNKVRA